MANFMIKYHERGFALVAALMAILILTAAGLLAFTVSTQDIRMSGRIVGEKKAISAAEAGAHWLSQTFDPSDLSPYPRNNVVVDSTIDPGSQFSVAIPARPTSGAALLPITGYSLSGGQPWGQARYNTRVIGENTRYASNIQVNLGVGYGPVEMSTTYR